jgi:hypothetical protein
MTSSGYGIASSAASHELVMPPPGWRGWRDDDLGSAWGMGAPVLSADLLNPLEDVWRTN